MRATNKIGMCKNKVGVKIQNNIVVPDTLLLTAEEGSGHIVFEETDGPQAVSLHLYRRCNGLKCPMSVNK